MSFLTLSLTYLRSLRFSCKSSSRVCAITNALTSDVLIKITDNILFMAYMISLAKTASKVWIT